MKFDCLTLDRLLPEFMDGSLTARMEVAAGEHLATCEDCRLVVDEMQAVTALYRDRGRIAMPAETRERLREQLRNQL